MSQDADMYGQHGDMDSYDAYSNQGSSRSMAGGNRRRTHGGDDELSGRMSGLEITQYPHPGEQWAGQLPAIDDAAHGDWEAAPQKEEPRKGKGKEKEKAKEKEKEKSKGGHRSHRHRS